MRLLQVLFLIFALINTTFAAKITDPVLNVGKQAANDFTILHKDGGYLKKVGSQGDWFFSKDGVLEKKIGSGSGGSGDGINGFGDTDNANAEDNTSGWTKTGANATFTSSTTDPLEGDRSFVLDTQDQNDEVVSNVLSFDKDVFRGRACEARFEYIGGDENLVAEVLDGNNDVLGSFTIKAHTISAPESIFFLCPSQTEITGDANKGNLRFKIRQTTTTNAVSIKWDLTYLGTLRGLVETQLPDVLNSRIEASCTAFDSSIFNGCTYPSTGVWDLDYTVLGLTDKPVIHATGESETSPQGYSCGVDNVTATTARIYCNNVTTGAREGRNIMVTLAKRGADAKQSVQVYKLLPKVSENVNELTAFVSDSGGVNTENVDFLNGNCTLNATGDYTCNYNAGLLTVVPSIKITSNDSNPACDHVFGTLYNSTPTTFSYYMVNSTAVRVNCRAGITVSKQGADFKLPTVQPVMPLQVSSFEQGGVNIGRCMVHTNTLATGQFGTPTSACAAWVDSFVNTATGKVQFNLKSGFSKNTPICTCMSIDAGGATDYCGGENGGSNWSNTAIEFTSRTQTSANNRDISVICIGDK